MARKKRVAVLGGGLGAVSAAFYLSRTAEQREKLQVTVYTMGHRLGGKAASGRNLARGMRIEEHGLHILLGFYEHAFSLIREAWAAWTPPPESPLQTWQQAFTPDWRVTFPERALHGEVRLWEPWVVDFPKRPGLPGDGSETAVDYAGALFDWMEGLAEEVDSVELAPRLRQLAALRLADGLLARPAARLLERLDRLASRMAADVGGRLHARGDRLRRLARLLRLGLAITRGYVLDVRPHGPEAFESIDHLEFREWLMQHGADEELAWWGPVRSLYTLGFAFRGGANTRPEAGAIAAGVALRILFRIGLAYKHAPMWRMNGGMGDVVFSPLYEVLRQRGVRFRFFRQVERVGLSRDGRRVASVDLGVQAHTRGEYRPLVHFRGLPVWPSEPLWPLMAAGTRRLDYDQRVEPVARRRLRLGRDFDEVVLGFPAPAVPGPLRALRRVEGWDEVFAMPTVATQSAQVWMKPELAELGWPHGPTVMTGFAPPLDSWGEMSHLLPMEEVDAGSLHYLTASLPEGARPQRQLERWLDRRSGWLFPSARAGDGFDRSLIVEAYLRENRHGSERYVQSPPGTTAARKAPGDSGVDNLALAGDWTKTTLSAGSAESAVESGRLAAEALLRR